MGWWPGRKAAEPTRPFVPAWLQEESSQAGNLPRGYLAQLDEVYRRNPVGLRAVRLVAGLVGALPLFVEAGDAKSIKLVRAGGLMERAAASLLLHGNFSTTKLYSWATCCCARWFQARPVSRPPQTRCQGYAI